MENYLAFELEIIMANFSYLTFVTLGKLRLEITPGKLAIVKIRFAILVSLFSFILLQLDFLDDSP